MAGDASLNSTCDAGSRKSNQYTLAKRKMLREDLLILSVLRVTSILFLLTVILLNLRRKGITDNLRGFDCYTYSPCYHQQEFIGKSIENMDTDVKAEGVNSNCIL